MKQKNTYHDLLLSNDFEVAHDYFRSIMIGHQYLQADQFIGTKDARYSNALTQARVPDIATRMNTLVHWIVATCDAGLTSEVDFLGLNPDPMAGLDLEGTGDYDRDGLPDAWEIAGRTPDGVLLPGADPKRKDVYVQFNWMSPRTKSGEAQLRQSTAVRNYDADNAAEEAKKNAEFAKKGENKRAIFPRFNATAGKTFEPSAEQVRRFREYYANLDINDFSPADVKPGINVHIDAGNSHLSTDNFGSQTSGGQTLGYKPFFAGNSANKQFIPLAKAELDKLPHNRKGVYYQMQFVDLMYTDRMPSGTGLLPEAFSAIAMGSMQPSLPSYIGDTMAHEFGHNLGLDHNGAISLATPNGDTRINRREIADNNYVVDYKSIMNYKYTNSASNGGIRFFDPARTGNTTWDTVGGPLEFVSDADNMIVGLRNLKIKVVAPDGSIISPAGEEMPITVPEEDDITEVIDTTKLDLKDTAEITFAEQSFRAGATDSLRYTLTNRGSTASTFTVTATIGGRTVTQTLEVDAFNAKEVEIPLTVADLGVANLDVTIEAQAGAAEATSVNARFDVETQTSETETPKPTPTTESKTPEPTTPTTETTTTEPEAPNDSPNSEEGSSTGEMIGLIIGIIALLGAVGAGVAKALGFLRF